MKINFSCANLKFMLDDLIPLRSRFNFRCLALEDFGCLSNKCVALALFTKFLAVLISKMEFFSMLTPNACIGLALDFLAHYTLYVIDVPRSIKSWCALGCIGQLLTTICGKPGQLESGKSQSVLPVCNLTSNHIFVDVPFLLM